ncbi:MAG: hypothetical protein R8M37_02225 [Alphaproteobacteria bacterium]|nr:hypothetical protein [Alphaproteobacteria bacterium]
MSKYCPKSNGKLECTQQERLDELYRQMDEALLSNKQWAFLTGGDCVANAYDCLKLRAYLEKQKSK